VSGGDDGVSSTNCCYVLRVILNINMRSFSHPLVLSTFDVQSPPEKSILSLSISNGDFTPCYIECDKCRGLFTVIDDKLPTHSPPKTCMACVACKNNLQYKKGVAYRKVLSRKRKTRAQKSRRNLLSAFNAASSGAVFRRATRSSSFHPLFNFE